MHALIAPDKFKGTLTARQAAEAIARGWLSARPEDTVELIPMSDGGDGFGEVLGTLAGAQMRTIHTRNAAHQPVTANWWFDEKNHRAIIESARVIGLAMLPARQFHPFQLDTFGLGHVLKAAQNEGARECVLGLGGSATNDGGFGLAQALGWEFLDAAKTPLKEWWQLRDLAQINKPAQPLTMPIVVALDVTNPLLGATGCSRIYGPQKGLRQQDFDLAEHCLETLATILKLNHDIDCAANPGAGAAGGLGFGLMAFAQARGESGFEIIARETHLTERIQAADLVITGEGAVDEQTSMGKGVGQIAARCNTARVPCIAMAGVVKAPQKSLACFQKIGSLTSLAGIKQTKTHAAKYLEALAKQMAKQA
jgi:glycerate kinase